MRRIVATMAVLLVLATMAVPAEAVNFFATPSIQSRWAQDESRIENFWGPLSSSQAPSDGEAYKEAPGGRRSVQYFDKGRIEETGANVTSGLLATELITGKVQIGDATFETRTPARVPVAGDPDNTGPTYAEMATLPEFRPKPPGGIDMAHLLYRNGQFVGLPFDTSEQVIVVKRDANGPAFTYSGDPAMRYGAFVFQPFYDFINGTPDGPSRIGYPIRPYFMADVKIGGTVTRVVVQAFERRVLTYNPKNPEASRVEFGNIGQHYYRWRYQTPVSPAGTAAPNATPSVSMGDQRIRATPGSSAVVAKGELRLTVMRLLDPAMREYTTPEAGKKYISVEVVLENLSTRDFDLSVLPYRLRTTDGFEYEPTYIGVGGQSIFTSGLSPGGKRQGVVSWLVPQGSRVQWMRYRRTTDESPVYFDFA